MKSIQDVPVILRREIEALMVAPFLEAFAEELGWDRTREIASKVIAQLAKKSGEDSAKMAGGNTFEHFKQIFPAFGKDGILVADLHVEENGSCLHMDVSHCEYAAMYERIGLKDMGTLLSCERDSYFFEGFNSDLEFSRPSTIMEGGECCGFCMRKKE